VFVRGEIFFMPANHKSHLTINFQYAKRIADTSCYGKSCKEMGTWSMRIDFFGKTDKGKVRRGNEDYFACEKVKSEEHLFVVADGMGGHRAGDVASKLGTQTFIKQYKKYRKKNQRILAAMNHAVEKANLAILKKSTSDPKKRGMGTTFSAIVVADLKAYIVHVGDSRIYLIREDKIAQLTTDHTFVGKMVEEGRITIDEARQHPQKNILYMSMGARDSFEPELNEYMGIKEGDVFIMCSDGLNNMVSDATIKEYAQAYEPKDAVNQLINLANNNGGTDNITALIIQVSDFREPAKTEPIPINENIEEKSLFKKLFNFQSSKHHPTGDREDT
jgi:PPM family protein phosphatase